MDGKYVHISWILIKQPGVKGVQLKNGLVENCKVDKVSALDGIKIIMTEL